MFNKKGQIVVAVDKKKLDNPNEIVDTVNVANTTDVKPTENSVETFAETVKAESTLNGTLYAYAVKKVDNRQYDVIRVTIDPITLKSVAEKFGKTYDSENRAYRDVQSAVAADMVMKKKEEARLNKANQKKEQLENG